MNYKFDNLNDKIPWGRKIHSKLENYLRLANTKEEKKKASAPCVDKEGHTFPLRDSCTANMYSVHMMSKSLTINWDRDKERQEWRDLNHKKYDLLDHFT